MQHCHLTLRYLEPGYNSLITGLTMLADRGELRLTFEVLQPPAPLTDGPWHLRNKAESGASLILDRLRSAFIDVHDSWEVDAPTAAQHDVYFKRSYDPARFPPQAYPRIRPLGLVSDVRADGLDLRELQRIVAQHVPPLARAREATAFLAESLAAMLGVGPRPSLSLLQAPPPPCGEPRILFMAGLWDPSQVPAEAPGKAAEFEAINETRAGCVRLLRRAFGDRFFGGVIPSEFAARRYADVLLPTARAASKRAYIRRVRDYPICIATTGLHGSNGWKLTDYVGLSRAIVTEPLAYAVPGDFAPGTNYLEFATPEACVARAGELMESPALRQGLMRANWEYYNRWMRPDALARYVLETIEGMPP